ncbi:mitochondrial coenzyme A diphosphatase NUDT8 [Clinocottus analis]|uniref:mitochondrial coenzyme A diphosphatase NUDT8 n=1 Tax=Clinocottus analis TaxID=304258 RepID=UPI0035BF7641
MFRGPQVLIRSCPLRPLVLVRESRLSGFSELTAAGWQGARDAKRTRDDGIPGGKEGPPSSAPPSTQLSSFNLNCDNPKQREASFRNLRSKAISSSYQHLPQVPASANHKAVSAQQDCLINTTCLQPRGRPQDVRQASHSSSRRPQCNLLQSRQHFVRPFGSSTRASWASWVSNHFHVGEQPSGVCPQKTREVHQAAPHQTDVWRGCLSPNNENRCRESLGPNLKLYDAGKKEGKKGRWASVLVSLCSNRGEPAFLFTLRSSTLKGRHKGDVSFAGGKSDPSDSDVVATALREAREELGVSVATEQVWGTLKPLRDMSGMMIAPVLANLGPIEELSFKPNPGEVEEIFTLSLSHLCNPQNRGYTHFRVGDKYGYTVPVFRNGKHRVWGLTAIALDHTLKLIVPD